MRQIVVVAEVLRGCGRAILEDFRRFSSTICFLVVSVSQIGAEAESSSSSESSSSWIRLFFSDEFVFSFSFD
jgi:hypothetical protein